jgi:hypothetical protein
MALVRIGKEKRHELLRGRVLDVCLQVQRSVWSAIKFGIQRADQCGIEGTDYKLELSLCAHHGTRACGY